MTSSKWRPGGAKIKKVLENLKKFINFKSLGQDCKISKFNAFSNRNKKNETILMLFLKIINVPTQALNNNNNYNIIFIQVNFGQQQRAVINKGPV